MGKRGPPFVDHFWRGFPAEQIITHGRVTFCSAEIPFQKRPTFRGHVGHFFAPGRIGSDSFPFRGFRKEPAKGERIRADSTSLSGAAEGGRNCDPPPAVLPPQEKTLLAMISVILSEGMKMRDDYGMLRGVYISGHDFLSYFQVEGVRGTSMECLGEYTFLVMTSVILSSGIKMRHMATDDRRQTTDDRGQTTDDRRQTTDDS